MATIAHRARGRLGRLARTARTDRWSARGLAVVALACAGVILAVASAARTYGFADLMLQRDALAAWLAGDGLYRYLSPTSHLGYPLPPTAAYLQLPAVAVPLQVAGWCIALAGVAALVLALIALVGPVARRHGRRRWIAVLAAAALALLLEPVRAGLGLGHLDLLLFGLITADVVALRRRAWARRRAAWWPGRPAPAPVRVPVPGQGGSAAGRTGRSVRDLARQVWATGGWAGFGTGLATAIGVSPVIFVGYLALTRQWRAALTAAGTALTVTVTAFLLAPAETVTWLTDILWRTDRTGGIDGTANQSLAGVLARLYDSTTTPLLLWLSFASLILAVGIIRARSAHADGDEITAFTLVGLTGCVIGPVAGTHELVWVLPAVLILVDVAARRRSARRLPRRRGLLHGGGPAVFRRPGKGPLRHLPSLTVAGPLIAAGAVYLVFVVAPVWAYRHQLPETSHRSDGLVGMLGENSFALVLILLVSALPWRPGAAPAFPSNRWTPAPRRRIPPARRPLASGS